MSGKGHDAPLPSVYRTRVRIESTENGGLYTEGSGASWPLPLIHIVATVGEPSFQPANNRPPVHIQNCHTSAKSLRPLAEFAIPDAKQSLDHALLCRLSIWRRRLQCQAF